MKIELSPNHLRLPPVTFTPPQKITLARHSCLCIFLDRWVTKCSKLWASARAPLVRRSSAITLYNWGICITGVLILACVTNFLLVNWAFIENYESRIRKRKWKRNRNRKDTNKKVACLTVLHHNYSCKTSFCPFLFVYSRISRLGE